MKGTCQVHAYYDRSLVDFIGASPVRHSLCILRLICTCGHTHAILPDFIIPYSGYGLFFILRILAEYFLRLSTVEKICERFSITLSQLHRWLRLSQMQKEEWLGALTSIVQGLSDQEMADYVLHKISRAAVPPVLLKPQLFVPCTAILITPHLPDGCGSHCKRTGRLWEIQESKLPSPTLRSYIDNLWNFNLPFASLSICRPTARNGKLYI